MPAKILVAALLAVMVAGQRGTGGRSGGGGGRGSDGDDEAGCCYGADARCNTDSKSDCARMAGRRGCEWLSGDDADCTSIETPTTTGTPGCCKGTSRSANDACNAIEDQDQCDRRSSCTFIAFGILDIDCVFPQTQPPPTTTEEPGCCKGTSRSSNDACNAIEDPDQCRRRSSCTFISFGILDIDCVFPQTEPPPTTTSQYPGCCKGTSRQVNDACNAIEKGDQCERRSSCTFIVFGILNEDCVFPETEPPEEAPGCCFSETGNSRCESSTSRATCERKGRAGCEWREGEGEDLCAQPTTTATPGCCKGTSRTANNMCNAIEDDAECDRNPSCTFIAFGIVNQDCVFPQTEPPPTTTTTPGCCKGTSRPVNDACNAIEDGDQCDREPSCTFIAFGIVDIECMFPQTQGPDESAMLFNDNTEVSEAMAPGKQVSLSTVLFLAVVALSAQQLFKWYTENRGGYTKLTSTDFPQQVESTAAYQTV